MSRDQFEERLNAYFDDELNASEREAFLLEVRSQPRKRWDFKLYRKIFQVLRELDAEAPEGLADRIKQQIQDLEVSPLPISIWSSFRPHIGFGLAAAAVFMLTLFLGDESRRVQPPRLAERPAPIEEALSPRPVLAHTQLAQAPAEKGPIKIVPQGLVEILSKKSITWSLARSGDTLDFEDRIRTGSDGEVWLVYPDKTWMKIRPGSLVQVLDQAVRVFQGDTWIKVEKRGSRFEARTPNAVASVRGTIYSVHVKRRSLAPGELLALAESGTQIGLQESIPASPSAALLSATNTNFSVARHLWQQMLGETETKVKVFESVVAVSSLDPETQSLSEPVLVPAGQQTEVEGVQVASLQPLRAEDYLTWKLPVPKAALAVPSLPKPLERPLLTQPARPVRVPSLDELPARLEGEVVEVDDTAAEVEDPGGPSSTAVGRPDLDPLGFDNLNR